MNEPRRLLFKQERNSAGRVSLDVVLSDDVEMLHMTPQECVLDAVLRAQSILAEYIEPGSHDCARTINRLFDIFDDEELMAAVNKLNLDLAQVQLGTTKRPTLSKTAADGLVDEID